MPHFSVGNQTIIQADCLQELKKFENGFFDVIVTSPPYNIGMDYGSYEDNLEGHKYLLWLNEVFAELYRVMHAKSSFFLNLGFNGEHPWVDMDVANVARKYFKLQNRICWVKSITLDVYEKPGLLDGVQRTC